MQKLVVLWFTVHLISRITKWIQFFLYCEKKTGAFWWILGNWKCSLFEVYMFDLGLLPTSCLDSLFLECKNAWNFIMVFLKKKGMKIWTHSHYYLNNAAFNFSCHQCLYVINEEDCISEILQSSNVFEPDCICNFVTCPTDESLLSWKLIIAAMESKVHGVMPSQNREDWQSLDEVSATWHKD